MKKKFWYTVFFFAGVLWLLSFAYQYGSKGRLEELPAPTNQE